MGIKKFFSSLGDGPDLVEYALMAGFVAVAAGAIVPTVATNIEAIFQSSGGLDASMVRIICAVLAVLLLGLIVLRRRKNVEE